MEGGLRSGSKKQAEAILEAYAGNEGVKRGRKLISVCEIVSKGGIRINYLLFADDCVIFCRSKMEEWFSILHLLKQYEDAFGQTLNRQKTTNLFSSNTKEATKECISQHADGVTCDNYNKYLDLPIVVGKSKYNSFRGLKEKIWKRISSWKTGKEILIKSVLQAIPIYTISVFRLPKLLLKDIESMIANFWWSHKKEGKGINWRSWSKLGSAKNMVGFGFRDLHCFNRALIAKQGWRIIKDPGSLVACIYKEKYFPTSQFFDAKLGYCPSQIWRSL